MWQSIVKSSLLFFCLPAVALAHTGAGSSASFMQGLGHPISGLDHLLAMVAVGIWAVQSGGALRWQLPTVFVMTMAAGAAFGLLGFNIPFIEGGILLSILVLGGLIASARRLSPAFSLLLVGLFALFHGHAHGAEMPATAATTTYIIGFALSTAALHLSGVITASLLRHTQRQQLTRLSGAIIALAGIYLALA